MAQKGVILCGGMGSRLHPLSLVTNKHLLPVFNKPMVFHPIEFLRDSGITDLLIVLGGNSVGDFVNLLGNGVQLGVTITYKYQYKAGGIADALKLAKDFVGNDPFAIMLGDNIFELPMPVIPAMLEFLSNKSLPSAVVFTSPTDRPSSFGVPTFNEFGKIIKVTEKPEFPDSNFAITGLYLYDKYVWSMIDSLKPSNRGELEISHINSWYIENGELNHILTENWWHDAGSIMSLMKVSQLVMERDLKNAAK